MVLENTSPHLTVYVQKYVTKFFETNLMKNKQELIRKRRNKRQNNRNVLEGLIMKQKKLFKKRTSRKEVFDYENDPHLS